MAMGLTILFALVLCFCPNIAQGCGSYMNNDTTLFFGMGFGLQTSTASAYYASHIDFQGLRFQITSDGLIQVQMFRLLQIVAYR